MAAGISKEEEEKIWDEWENKRENYKLTKKRNIIIRYDIFTSNII